MNPYEFELYGKVSGAMGIEDFSKSLIHYTTIDNFESIVSSRELWFGRLPDLNDTTESSHFLDGLGAAVEKLVGPVAYSQIQPLVERSRRLVREKTYVSSWSEYFDDRPNGRLPMWRQYSGDGAGVGLVVDASQFQPSVIDAKKMHFFIHSTKVDYVTREQAMNYASDLIDKVMRVPDIRRLPQYEFFISMMLLAKAPCVKIEDFDYEKEIRFLSTIALRELLGQPTFPQRIASSTDGSRRFLVLKLQNYPEFNFDLSIEKLLTRVLVGPGENQASRLKQVEVFLAKNGMNSVDIFASNIPLRDWQR